MIHRVNNTVDMEQKYVISNIDVGWVGILCSARGLLRLTFPQPTHQEAHRQLGDSVSSAQWSPQLCHDLVQRLEAYFSGEPVTFPDELDLSAATPFQRQVWQKTRLILYSETRSYGWVAEQIKQPGAARAVGQTLGRNPLPVIIPCHRVVTSDGRLGGYSEGLETKEHLLRLEASARAR